MWDSFAMKVTLARLVTSKFGSQTLMVLCGALIIYEMEADSSVLNRVQFLCSSSMSSSKRQILGIATKIVADRG